MLTAGRSKLSARGLVVNFRGRQVLAGADLDATSGEVVTLAGASGAGKSTLLGVLAGLRDADLGVVALDGIDARALPPRQYRRRVAYVMQHPPMIDGSVAANVALGPGFAGVRLAPARVLALLDAVGVSHLAERDAGSLSGGEKQRVALARALANEPEVLLLDEPTSALDPAAAAHLMTLVRTLAERGLAIVLATHVEAHAMAFSGPRLQLADGRINGRPSA